MTANPDQCSCGHVEGRSNEAYNEEAFRYFLEIERKRSEISSRPFLLLLVDLMNQPGGSVDITESTAADLFSQLSLCLRDTDFLGWYHEGRVTGAVLTQRPDTPNMDVSERVAERVRRALGAHFDSHLGGRLQVRVYQVPPMPEREILAGEGQI